MQKKILSNENSKLIEKSTVYADDTSNQIVIQNATVGTASVPLSDGLLIVNNKQISNITASAVSGNVLQVDNGQFTPKAILGLGSLGGDLNGLISNAQVVSIANVESGTLGISVGGTGKTALSSGSILAINQSNIAPETNGVISVSADGTQWQIASSSNFNITALQEPLVYLYTGSVAGTSPNGSSAGGTIYTWNKPAGTRFVRVLVQGGGGAGAGCSAAGNGGTGAGGGGGGGGYSETCFNAISIPDTVTITVGNGGKGFSGGGTGVFGGSSSFGNYISTNGGAGGVFNSSANTTPAIGGAAYIEVGGSGGGTSIPGSTTVAGAGGGKGLLLSSVHSGGNVTGISNGGAAGVSGSPDGKSPVGGNTIKFNTFYLGTNSGTVISTNFPKLVCGGGGGAFTDGNGGSPEFGAGGGGAAAGGSKKEIFVYPLTQSSKFTLQDTSPYAATTYSTSSLSPLTMSLLTTSSSPTRLYNFDHYALSSSYVNSTSAWTLIVTNNINIGTGDFSLECWVNLKNVGSSSNASYRSLILDTGGNIHAVHVSGSSPGATTGWFCFTGGATVRNTNIPMNANNWYHLALVNSSNNLELYVNGTGSGNPIAGTYTNVSTFQVGQGDNNGAYNINGCMAGLRYTGYAYSPAYIKSLYENPSPVTASSFETIGGNGGKGYVLIICY